MLPKSWKSVSILKLLQENTMDLTTPAHCGIGSAFNVTSIMKKLTTNPFALLPLSSGMPTEHH